MPAPKVLESRNQYRSCHIRLPGDEQRVAAIVVDGKYYSLLKVVKEPQRALELANRLALKGNETIITKLAKGHAIWAFEPDACVDPSQPCPAQLSSQTFRLNARILEDRSQYKPCHIHLSDSDVDQRLAAILLDGKYYGLLRAVSTREQALDLAARLERKGDEAIITKTAHGFAIWAFEPDAVLV